jgi:hypothetical protein
MFCGESETEFRVDDFSRAAISSRHLYDRQSHPSNKHLLDAIILLQILLRELTGCVTGEIEL